MLNQIVVIHYTFFDGNKAENSLCGVETLHRKKIAQWQRSFDRMEGGVSGMYKCW